VLVDEADRLLVRSPSLFLVFSDSTDIQNTVYDDERVVLDVPPPLPATLVVTVDSTIGRSDLVLNPGLIAPTSTPGC
jgi:hypothetical protein